MPYENINAELSAADIKAIKDALAGVANRMPWLITMTPRERQRLLKTGPDSLSFVQNALTAVQNNANALPPAFDAAGFARDVALFTALTDLGTVVSALAAKVDDTRLALGGEAMQSAIHVYDYVKAGAKRTPGLKPVAAQLGERFKRAGVKRTPAPASA